MIYLVHPIRCAIVVTAMSCLLGSGRCVADQPTLVDRVASLFERRCVECHHDQQQKGGLSLSDPSVLREVGYVDTADVEASYLLELVTQQADGTAEMPKDARPLAESDVELLGKWIAGGAKWPENRKLEPPVVTDLDWWSLRPVEYALPARRAESVLLDSQATSPVDRFIDAKLAEKGLKPVGQADPQTLIRRLTYDLTGLPPTPNEVDAFLASSAVNPDRAWESAVDRLLSSPAFGEKWGQHWLDLARYAETHGYDKDKPRENAWPYRDYVIRSFNGDKSYSRFVQEQIAGDYLFPDDPDGVLGLGFLAAGPWDFIGHWEVGEEKLDGRIAKHLDRDEMVSAVFNVFMSTTVQCAQCHHHKFDPIRMEDYYRLHAVFSAIDRADRIYAGLSIEDQQRKRRVLAKQRGLKDQRQKLTTKIERQLAAKTSHLDRRIEELFERYAADSPPSPQYGYHSEIASSPTEVKWVQVDLGTPLRIEQVRIFPAYDQFAGIGAGFGYPLRYRVEASNDASFETGVRLLLDATDEDQPNPMTRTIEISGSGKPARFVRLTATKLRERKNDYMLAIGEMEVWVDAVNVATDRVVTAKDSIEQPVRWRRGNLVDGIYYRELSNDAALIELSQLRQQRAAIERSLRPDDLDKRLAEIDERLGELDAELAAFPAGKMVYAAATHFSAGGRFVPTGGNPRPIHLLHRGDLRSPGKRMLPGAPPLWNQATARFIDSEQENHANSGNEQWDEAESRAELARYLTRNDNPLFWRSIANRLWLWTFGAPLVGTPNDFGRGGLQPTHPELLDYLAAKLRDDPDHSLKSIVRMLVTSRVYRRSSRGDTQLAKLDASNAYHWRANRRRLTAEEFRDSLLAAAGLLDRKSGGPSFQDFVIEKPQHSPHYQYHLHDPSDPRSHRRTIYRMVVRSQPQPLLTTLDCADPSISVPRRDESTTALQALAAWNNRLIEFAARTLGDRIAGLDAKPAQQIRQACRWVLGREPSPAEMPILETHLRDHGPPSLARILFNMNAFVYLD